MGFSFPDKNDNDGPWPIFERVLATFPELAPLKALIEDDVTVAFAMKRDPEKGHAKNGKVTLGTCCMPMVQGALRPLFDQLLEDALGYFPDFLIILNAEWWEIASARDREILVVHEALHAGQARDQYGELRFNPSTGRPVLGILPHDVEEFSSVARRYGAWKSDLVEFQAALAEHDEVVSVMAERREAPMAGAKQDDVF